MVEDEKPMARALELKLTSSGFSVTVSYNGQEALDLLKNNKFDLILLDLIMPIKDGFAVLQELKDSGSRIPVIVSSNLSQKEDFDRAKSLGAVDYFVKSDTSIVEVVNHVKKVLA